jgi:hypothetical protein
VDGVREMADYLIRQKQQWRLTGGFCYLSGMKNNLRAGTI